MVHFEERQGRLASMMIDPVAAVEFLVARSDHQSCLSVGALLAFFVAGQKPAELLIVRYEADWKPRESFHLLADLIVHQSDVVLSERE